MKFKQFISELETNDQVFSIIPGCGFYEVVIGPYPGCNHYFSAYTEDELPRWWFE